jgi:hypothetical protein
MAGACSTNREVTRPDPVEITDELLAKSVLTVGDLPSGWTAVPAPVPFATELLPEDECDDPLAAVEPAHEAAATFALGGVTFTNQIVHLANGQAYDELVFDMAEDCAELVLDDETAVRTGAFDFGALTANSLAVKVEVERPSGPIEERDFVVLRRGNLVSILRAVGPRPIDTDVFDTAARRALNRLAALDEAT